MEFCVGDNFLRNVRHSQNPEELAWDTVVMSKAEYERVCRNIQNLGDELKAQRGLNANYVRITRERANAQRGLRPKKDHYGYAVLSSAERDIIYRMNDVSHTASVWETLIQTPYRTDCFSAEQVESQVEYELYSMQEYTVRLPIVSYIGINRVIYGGYAALKKEIIKTPDIDSENVVFSTKFRANYRSCYWEVTIQHTNPLGIVPEELLPISKKME